MSPFLWRFKPFKRFNCAELALSAAEGFKPPPPSSPATRGRMKEGLESDLKGLNDLNSH
jgi:hypothetical protein